MPTLGKEGVYRPGLPSRAQGKVESDIQEEPDSSYLFIFGVSVLGGGGGTCHSRGQRTT